jgi:Na+:H+ antiporter, NhaA family
MGGLFLIVCAGLSLALSNSRLGDVYLHFWHHKLNLSFLIFELDYSFQHWINDGLMTIFFLLVGLEIERELYVGELSSVKKAGFPIFAALGGMVVPALIHFLLNHGKPTQSGAGIPMATDIAFTLGILSLLGKRVPSSLKVFLAAFAIMDDLGAVLVIALFYTTSISFTYLLLCAGIFLVLVLLNRFRVTMLFPYVILGLVMWYCMSKSGVHATISGVLLAFAIPFAGGDRSPSFRILRLLHKPVGYLILPLFAAANTALMITGEVLSRVQSSNSLGIILGLVLGKPLGIFLFSLTVVSLNLCRLPESVTWKQIGGAGMLGGVGFTMSIFIANLAFPDFATIEASKIAVLFGSLLAGIAGFGFLKVAGSR